MRDFSMSDPKFHRTRLLLSTGSLLAFGLLTMSFAVSAGCAQAESKSWAQTSPLIEPEKRDDGDYHLSAHDDVAREDDDQADAGG